MLNISRKVHTRMAGKKPALTVLMTSFREFTPLIMAVDARNTDTCIHPSQKRNDCRTNLLLVWEKLKGYLRGFGGFCLEKRSFPQRPSEARQPDSGSEEQKPRSRRGPSWQLSRRYRPRQEYEQAGAHFCWPLELRLLSCSQGLLEGSIGYLLEGKYQEMQNGNAGKQIRTGRQSFGTKWMSRKLC